MKFEMIWLVSLLGLIAVAFFFDLLFGPIVLRWARGPLDTLVFGIAYGVVAFGPYFASILRH